MLPASLPPLVFPWLHNGTFTWDEFLCTGLVALVLVVGAFVVLRLEKEGKEDRDGPASKKPAEE